MSSLWFFTVIEVSVIACGLVSGVFLAFSDFIMRSLDGSEKAAGVEVMQVINREVFRTVFMFLLIGMSILFPLIAGYAYYSISGPTAGLIMTGGTVYFFGVFVVSIFFNIPMNERLDKQEYAGAEAATYWSNVYFPRWTFWNYVRAISSSGAAVCFLVACIWMAQGAMVSVS